MISFNIFIKGDFSRMATAEDKPSSSYLTVVKEEYVLSNQ